MSLQSASILVVDDDVDTCQNLSDILADIGYNVTVAHNGPQALESIRQQAFDVALLDLKMPGMDGLTLYREIKKCRAGTVAIVISGFVSPESEAAAYGAGCLRVLSKPVDFGVLLPLLAGTIQQPTVLIVDDDRDLCANLWDLLRMQGYRVCLAHDEQQAIKRLQDRRFKLILLDLKLPGEGGRSLLHKIHEANPDTRVVLITGHREQLADVVQQALSGGADTVLYKPFEVPMLLKTVERLARG